MNIIIPVAGEGTRLRPLTHTVPKCLLYVAGKPILGHILDRLKGLNISKLVIVLGSKGDEIIQFCKKYSYNFRFVNQSKRLGLGHAIYTGAQGLKGATMVLLGDTIIDYDFKNFCNRNTNTLAVKEVAEPKRFGIVEVKSNSVVNLVEKPRKPKSNLAIAGLYFFQHIEKVYKAAAYIMRKGITVKGEYQLTDALKYRHLLKKTHHFEKRKKTIILSPVYIHNSAKILNSIIGPNVSISEKVMIKNSVIKESIINSGAIVENALLSDSIVGEKAVVKSGFKKLNLSDSSIIDFP
jgi:glucose-1-phosphate thymidylyltransferase